jgi:ribosomal protein L6P/L9E
MPEGVDLVLRRRRRGRGHRTGDSRTERSRHGLVRSLIANMVVGVTDGYSKALELVGVGYRAAPRARTSSCRSASRTRC